MNGIAFEKLGYLFFGDLGGGDIEHEGIEIYFWLEKIVILLSIFDAGELLAQWLQK